MASWASIARREAPKPKVEKAVSLDGANVAVLDANALISPHGLARLATVVQRLVTVPEALAEVRDKQSRNFLSSLPFEIVTMEPTPEQVAEVMRFARRTGDAAVISTVDAKIIALARMLEEKAHGDARIRRDPLEQVTLSRAPKVDPLLPGWGDEGGVWTEMEKMDEEQLARLEAASRAKGGAQSRVAAQTKALEGGADEGHGADEDAGAGGALNEEAQRARSAAAAVPPPLFTFASPAKAPQGASTDEDAGKETTREAETQQANAEADAPTTVEAPAPSAPTTAVVGTAAGFSSGEEGWTQSRGSAQSNRRAARKEKRRALRAADAARDATRAAASENASTGAALPGWGAPERATERAAVAEAPEAAAAAAAAAAASIGALSISKEEEEAKKEEHVKDTNTHEEKAGSDAEKEAEEAGSDSEEDLEEEAGDESEAESELEFETAEQEAASSAAREAEQPAAAPGASSEDARAGGVETGGAEALAAGAPSSSSSSSSPSSVCVLTGDFAMQNVILQMGLRLVTPAGQRVTRVARWALRCSACGAVARDAGRVFCPRCGNATLERVRMEVDAEGRVQVAGVRRRHVLKGTRFSLPRPRGGRKPDAILSEDVLLMRSGRVRRKAARAEARSGDAALDPAGAGLYDEYGVGRPEERPTYQAEAVRALKGRGAQYLDAGWRRNPNERKHVATNRRRK